MKLLIVTATKEEITPSIEWLNELKIRCLVTGVGMVATAYQLGKELAKQKYDLVVNVGIAGARSNSFQIGDIVRIKTDCFPELGAEDQNDFLSIKDLGFGTSIYSEVYTHNYKSLNKLPTAESMTVNTVHGDQNSIDTIFRRKPLIQIESMEGASVFYAANQTQIPTVQVRSVSNRIEPRDKNNWDIGFAISSLNKWIQEFTDEVYSQE